jgi:hypothetical protein
MHLYSASEHLKSPANDVRRLPNGGSSVSFSVCQLRLAAWQIHLSALEWKYVLLFGLRRSNVLYVPS